MSTVLLDNFNRGALASPFHLENHAVDTTGTGAWHNTAVLPGNLIVSSTNTVYPDSASGTLYYNDQTYTDNLETIICDLVAKSDIAGSSGFTARASSSADTELLFRIGLPGNGTAAIQVYQFSAGTPTQLGTNQVLGIGSYPAYTIGHTYRITVVMHNSTFDMTIQDVTAAGSAISVFSGQAFTGFTATGFIGIRADGAYTDTTGLHMDALTITNGTSVMSLLGNLGDVSVTGQFSASVAAPAASGGSGTYTYQWYGSTTVNFTPGVGNILSGQTSATINLTGLTPNTMYWVVCLISDGTTTIATNHRLVRLGGLLPIVFGVVGDSTSRIAAGAEDPYGPQVAPSHCKYVLSTRGGLRQVTLVNVSISGTSTADWQSGGTNMTNALASFAAAGVQYVLLRLGANDAQAGVASATFDTQYSNIITALTGAGYKVFLDYPTWREPGVDFESPGITFDETYAAFWWAYIGVIDTKYNATNIFRGGQQHVWASACRPAEQLDNSVADPGAIHWSNIGSAVAGGLDAHAFLQITDPALEVALTLSISVNGSGQPVLIWSSDPLATGYQVYRSATSAADMTLIASVGTATLTYTDTTPLAGTDFYAIVSPRT